MRLFFSLSLHSDASLKQRDSKESETIETIEREKMRATEIERERERERERGREDLRNGEGARQSKLERGRRAV